jgi:hypothetical protein
LEQHRSGPRKERNQCAQPNQRLGLNLRLLRNQRLPANETRIMALLIDRMPCKPSMSSAESLALDTRGTWTPDSPCNPFITQQLESCRRGSLTPHLRQINIKRAKKHRHEESGIRGFVF